MNNRMDETSISYDNMSNPPVSRPVFAKCLFCIPLRMGCLILGYLNLIATVLSIIAITGITLVLGYATHGFDHFDQPTEINLQQHPEFSKNSLRNFLILIEIFIAIALLMNFAWIVVDIACLIGVHKKRVGLFRLYISFASLRLIFILVGILYLVATNRSSLMAFAVEMFNFVLTAYFILIYYMYVKQTNIEENDKIYTISSHYNNNISDIYPTFIDKRKFVV